MGVSAERGKPLVDDYVLPIEDFLGAKGDAPLNLPTVSEDAIPDTLKVGPDLQKQFSDKLGDLSVDKLLNSPDSLTTAFVNAISPSDPSLGRTITSNEITGLVNEMTNELSATRRRLRNDPNTGPLTRGQQCQIGLGALTRALNRLTGGIFGSVAGLFSEIAAWLGIVNRLTCGGVPNAFSKLSPYMPTRAIGQVAVGSMLSAAKLGKPEVMIDIGNSPVASTIAQNSTGIATLGAKALSNFDISTVKDKAKFISDYDAAMSNLDPNWLSPDNHIVGFEKDGSKLNPNPGFAKYLETSLAVKSGSIDTTNLSTPTVDDKVALLAAYKDTQGKIGISTFTRT